MEKNMKQHIMRAELEQMEEPKNGDFVARLTPGIDRRSILGVRNPALRKLAKKIAAEGNAEAFMDDLPHRYLEENMIHAYLISSIKEFAACIEQLERFLPYVECWNVTDAIRPKVVVKHTEEAEPILERWLESDQPYTVRTAIGLYMAYYLDAAFSKDQAARIAAMRSEEYYVRMMQAWYMATGLAKQPEAILPLLAEERMDSWTHNMTIRKAQESFRVPDALKAQLKTMKRRTGE